MRRIGQEHQLLIRRADRIHNHLAALGQDAGILPAHENQQRLVDVPELLADYLLQFGKLCQPSDRVNIIAFPRQVILSLGLGAELDK